MCLTEGKIFQGDITRIVEDEETSMVFLKYLCESSKTVEFKSYYLKSNKDGILPDLAGVLERAWNEQTTQFVLRYKRRDVICHRTFNPKASKGDIRRSPELKGASDKDTLEALIADGVEIPCGRYEYALVRHYIAYLKDKLAYEAPDALEREKICERIKAARACL